MPDRRENVMAKEVPITSRPPLEFHYAPSSLSDSTRNPVNIMKSSDLAAETSGTINGSGIAVNGHDVPSSNTGPLTILIAGAGIGGLTAAIALRQQGHNIKLFEQSRLATEFGAAIHLSPNCNGILRRLGIDAESFGSNTANRFTELTAQGEVIESQDLRESGKIWQHKFLFAHRVHLHNALKEAAMAEIGSGTAELVTSSRVKSVDEQQASVTLENGDKIRGDAIIGADGMHSTTRLCIAPDLKPFSTGKNCFRFLLSRAEVEADPEIQHLAGEHGEMKVWHAADRRIVMYPTTNNTLLNFACMYPENESIAGSDYRTSASVETLLKVYSMFDPAVLRMLSTANPETLKFWPLLDLAEIPSYAKHRLALMGDAAHPFLPYQGQGGGQAIEDAATLSVVLPRGTPKDEIGERFRLYDRIRHERASRIQEYTRLTGADDLQKKNLSRYDITLYICGHDEFDNSAQGFREYQRAQVPPKC